MFARGALRQATSRFSGRTTAVVKKSTTRRVFSSQAPQANNGGAGGAMVLAGVALVAAAYSASNATDQANKIQGKLQGQIDDLQVQLSGKTNSAFVFLKPHACKGTPGKVEAVLEDALAKNGIRITGKGSMLAEEIDKKMYIDTHYGAIASKAVKLQPAALNVPDKGKADFQKAFGESWDDALKAGKIYNAKDGAEKLGVDSAGLNAKWGKLSRGKTLIKFGGGFYCGKVDDIYVMNGFYMSMRAAYCNPGEKIQWYTVSWPTDTLSWEDFRGKVLGATDPTAAPVGSVRRTILDNYRSLGLKSKPNTGDNGVHASASPFEAMAERANWLGAELEEDDFGKALLKKVSKDKVLKWSGDAQVTVDGETAAGKTMSVFDTLEDLDADTILKKVEKIH
ncbi:expressed unknown protein [Seminavis robusta]|uniref:Nucleoside-diphosphate kinase n=1 Tax=Seminavis robusta TaxID=568900 RepID=A0A9N8EXS4_9STRA|nr:expressed unknown protein [Seminavis robusta]|eukprot:Sro2019_g311330.1 n/a (395) ;mRNA; r:12742-14047